MGDISTAERPRIVIFGPQTALPDFESLSRLRLVLLSEPRLSSFLAAIQDLPQLWRLLVKTFPKFEAVPGLRVLESLKIWIRSGQDFPHAPSPLPNVLLAPLTIIIQIANYAQYLRVLQVQDNQSTHQALLKRLGKSGVQGLCIGVLSAIAVASSETEEELGAYGAVALRLAVCIGAVVDLEGAFASPPNGASCFTIRYGEKEKGLAQEILQQFPDSYISVNVDSSRLTVTSSKSTASLLMQRMSTSGLGVKPLELEGRFHNPIHKEALAEILSFCDLNAGLQFPLSEALKVSVRSNTTGRLFAHGRLSDLALASVLTEQPDWGSTIAEAAAKVECTERHVLAIGATSFIPNSISQIDRLQITYLQNFVPTSLSQPPNPLNPSFSGSHTLYGNVERQVSPSDIAIIGTACRFPGADNVEDLWDLLCAGKSMCETLPTSRFSPQDCRRLRQKDTRYWGNFIENPDVFDHRFFNMSSREAASTDPQQRLVLQVAYEAMESADYFDESARKASSIGCYLGVGSVDYYDNVACHPPSAFSASGTLRAFLSGKISHYFGWTGPSITYDTACSSSAVAIHSACSALRAGECSAALAGGVHLITSPALYQNLDKGGFLSPTGPSKSFDASADGYCRGEGAGLVVLKKLSQAIVDGDAVLGVIAGSAISQNSNRTPITVPDSQSQAELYKKATSMAGIDPRDIDFVEAHGTGTKVGDPIECESIRQVFGGSQRREKLYFGSIKANIGHLEGASGVAGLVKSLLMIQKGAIPVQSNFSLLNPKIPPLSPSKMAIPTATRQSGIRAICINNYGAAGSNAVLVLCAPPSHLQVTQRHSNCHKLTKLPISLSASTNDSLRAYCASLRRMLSQDSPASSADLDLASIAFNLGRRANRSLANQVNFTASSISEFRDEILSYESGSHKIQSLDAQAPNPIVLCFGGQTRDTVGLDEKFYRSVLVFQNHLDSCDTVVRSLGGHSMIPAIFSKHPVLDITLLHSMVFSLQYSCAMAWIDSGLKVDVLIGHSFGQLTALCVAGSLSLEHALKLIRGRATLIKELWGPERGAMLSVEANSQDLSELLSRAHDSSPVCDIEIACYNSATSHVLVGPTDSIISMEHNLGSSPGYSQSMKFKRLEVTHGYHSHLVDPILPGLAELADSLEFREGKIRIESTTDDQSWRLPNSALIARHSREPVYFSQAVHRIAERYGACTWLEAGSDSTITNMARRAIGSSLQDRHVFQSSSLTSPDTLDQLANATVNLWNAGVRVQFWPFHRIQRQDYMHINLPPYQFEKSRHWLEYKEVELSSPRGTTTVIAESGEQLDPVNQLLTFVSFMRPQYAGESLSEFSIDPDSKQFKAYVRGHSVLGNNLCPASLYIHLATKAVSTIIEEEKLTDRTLSVESLELESPLGIDTQKAISLKLKETDTDPLVWSFEICSYQLVDSSNHTRHATGFVYALNATNRKMKAEFARYERLTTNRHSQLVTHSGTDGAESVIQESFVYKAFSSVVNYSEYFRGVRRVAARDYESVGRVLMPEAPSSIRPAPDTFWDPLLVDNFLQVAGLHINCLRDKLESEIYICTKIDQLRVCPEFSRRNMGTWSVFSSFEELGEKELVNDIFVFDTETEKLAVVILGACFTKVSKGSLSKALSRINADKSRLRDSLASESQVLQKPSPKQHLSSPALPSSYDRPSKRESQEEEQHEAIPGAVRQLLSRVTDVSMELIQNDTALEAVGVDSLMTTEVLDELNEAFSIRIAMHELQASVDFNSLCLLVESKRPSGIHLTQKQEETSGTIQMPTVNGLEPSPNEDSPRTQPQGSREIGDASTDFATLPHLERFQHNFDSAAADSKLTGFYTTVYPRQAQLVVSYVVKAFESFGYPLSQMDENEDIPAIQCLPKHQNVAKQMYHILSEADIVRFQGSKYIRTGRPVDETPSQVLLKNLMHDFPQHALEHKLLSTTGSILADCLLGTSDPLQVLFGSRENRNLLEDVYTNAPMFATGTKILADFLLNTTAYRHASQPVRILEVGGGTGGTTKAILKQLVAEGIAFIYTFTDVSSSLLAAAKKKFANYADSMEFMLLDIENDPPENILDSQDIVISTNCIHATRSIEHSCSQIRKILRSNGILCLIELTRNLYWFDLVFGLLEGWWAFEDSRSHALAHESFWKQSLEDAGFEYVDWSRGQRRESELIRLIIAAGITPLNQIEEPFKQTQVTHPGPALEPERPGLSETLMETVLLKQEGRTPLYADIYYPERIFAKKTKLPIALMIHGGGHVMLSRKDIRPLQTQLLLDNGILPISIDHRLCPELDLLAGPMTDVCSALEWARNVLPTLELQRSDVEPDGSKVVVVGWSTGGMLAMSLGWTAPTRGLQPPEAILVFYSPTDYQSEWWTRPQFPWGTSQADADRTYDIWEAVRDTPITGFNIASARAIGGWMSTTDQRARIPLHMNWTAQTLPVLLGAATSRQKTMRRKKADAASSVPLPPLDGHSKLPLPTMAEIAPISPRAQIVSGAYATPTYLIHGTADEFIQWQESRDTYTALVERGVSAGLSIVEGGGHIFEMRGIPKGDPAVGRAVLEGYRFLLERVGVDLGGYGQGREKW